MKKASTIFLFIALFFGNYYSLAQVKQWLWANSAGGLSTDGPNVSLKMNEICPEGPDHVAVDESGNIYVIGDFLSSSIDLNSTTLENSENGSYDMYIIKYDPSGNMLWATSAGGLDDDIARCITTDKSGNVFVGGSFSSDTFTYRNTKLFNNLWQDIFLLKLDSNGDVIWAKNYGGPSYDIIYSIVTDNLGNVFIAGNYNSDTLIFETNEIYRVGTFGLYIIKFDGSGNLMWIKDAGGNYDDGAKSLAVDNSGNLFVTGYFESNNITFDHITLTTNGNIDIFLAKYDTYGNLQWLKGAGGDQNDYGLAVCTDSEGNAYVTGHFMSNTIKFNATITASNFVAGNTDIFVVKYNSSGNVIWGKSAGGLYDDISQGIKVNSNGELYISGSYASPNIVFNNKTIVNKGSSDIFLIKYNKSNGNIIQAESYGGSGNDEGRSIAYDKQGNNYITGSFQNSFSFGTIQINSSASIDMFVAKFDLDNTSIEDNRPNNPLSLYPNPSLDGNIVVNFNDLENKDFCLQVFDAFGRLVFDENYNSANKPNNNLDLSNEIPGVYLVKVLLESGDIYTHRAIITR